jgi:folliculin
MEMRPCLISLAHFCERHGPSIVFTTQKIHPSWDVYLFPASFLKRDGAKNETQMKKIPRELFPDEFNQDNSKNPTVEVVLKSHLNSTPTAKTDPSGKSCSTCSSVPDGMGFISSDETREWYETTTILIHFRTFISTQNPAPQFYGSVRSGCVKSLSCEFLPGKEGLMVSITHTVRLYYIWSFFWKIS